MRQRSRKRAWIGALVVLLIALFAYNYWSYQNGRCTMETLLSMSPLAILLIFCNFLALLSLQFIRLKNKRLVKKLQCQCGSQLNTQWGFCPNCGNPRNTPA